MEERIFKFLDSDNNRILLDAGDISFVRENGNGTIIYMKNGEQINTNYPYTQFNDFIIQNAMQISDFTN